MYFVFPSRCPICRLSGCPDCGLAGSWYWMDGMGGCRIGMCNCRCFPFFVPGALVAIGRVCLSGRAGTRFFILELQLRYRNRKQKELRNLGLYRCSWMPGDRNNTKQSIKRPVRYVHKKICRRSRRRLRFYPEDRGKYGGDIQKQICMRRYLGETPESAGNV